MFIFSFSFTRPSWADATLDNVLQRLDAVEKENASLKAEVQSLEQAQAAGPAAVSPAAVSAAAVPAPAPAPGLNFVTSKLKLNVYGFIDVENVYATNGASSAVGTASNVIEYLAPHYNTNKPQKTDIVSAQNSRLGINIAGPDVLQGKTSGKLELDFNATPTQSSDASTYTPRLRQGYAAIDWDKWGITAGQTWDFFSPLKTDIENFSGLWRGGDFGYRHPQAYLTDRWGDILGGKLTTQVGIIDTTDIYQDNSGAPAGGGYVNYTTKIAGKDVSLGVGGILGTTASSTENYLNKNSNDLYGGVSGAQVKLSPWLSIKGQGYLGGNLANFMSGPYGDSNPGTTDTGVVSTAGTTAISSQVGNQSINKPLKTIGGFAEVTLQPTKKLQFNLGAGLDDVTNRDSSDFIHNLAASADVTSIYSTNRTDFINAKYNLTKDLLVGIEYQFIQTHYIDNTISKDNRIDSFVQYSF